MPDAAGRPHVLLAIPYDRVVLGPFFQAVCRVLTDDLEEAPGLPRLKITPYVAPGAVVHLARDAMIRAALAYRPQVDYLVMVDSDQLFAPLTLRRLVGWQAPVVAPVIVQRNGPPIPVAYHEVGQDDEGYWRYEPQTAPIYAYLSQFNPDWWGNNGATGVLPLQPQHPPRMHAIPDEIAAGLANPLFPVDATGAGMVCLRHDVLESLEPWPESHLYCDFSQGGEDFSLSRNIRRAGWGGRTPGPRGPGLFADRGCLVGHLTFYAKGADDMCLWLDEEAAKGGQADAQYPPAVPDLVERLRRERQQREAVATGANVAAGVPADLPSWAQTALPGELAGVGPPPGGGVG